MTRDDLIAAFLAPHGATLADTEPLAQDASFRRYLRLRRPIQAVLMDAPPPEDVRSFLNIATHLRAQGLTVPEILDADPDIGLILEADFGDDLLSNLFDQGAAPDPLLAGAVDALIAWQRAAPPPDLPAWDQTPMIATALGTLFDWWWPARYGTPSPDEARADVAQALAEILRPVAEGPRCAVHRDWFAGNLLRLADGRIGIIDFQSAAIGHPAYDLASLLQDARRDIPPAAAARAFARYQAGRPDLDAEAFTAAYQACAAQRHLRVACQWVRLALRDGRPQYLAHGPRTWRLLRDALMQPAVAPLAAALDRWIPPADRGNPPGLAA
ncbi:MAG TPA: phosphotransferase [Rhodopila sp.]|jgi:aminoglycoside/choline kinase family phosphotransferase|nr:phosphotransferase [Rhodopila sp.]